MSNRRRVPDQKPSVEAVAESSIMDFANTRFDGAVRDWRSELVKEQERVAEELSHLPAHTVEVLKVTMALDRVGPKMPKRSEVYAKYGVSTLETTTG